MTFPRGKTYEQNSIFSVFLTIWCGHRCSCSCVRCSCAVQRRAVSTGLRAGEGDGAAVLSGLLAELPAHVVQSTLCALIWVLLPLVCAFLRPRELLLSAVAAARGFVLAMTVAVSVGEGNALIIGAAGVPAVLSVSALLAACSMVWQGGEATGRYSLRTCRMPYFLCITLAVLSALLRAAIADTVQRVSLYKMHRCTAEAMRN